MSRLCLVSISCPNMKKSKPSPSIKMVMKDLESHDINYSYVDTIQGWGNLNQDWLEFKRQMDLSWSWCLPSCLNSKQKKLWFKALNSGKLFMMVSYIEQDGTFTPHC